MSARTVFATLLGLGAAALAIAAACSATPSTYPGGDLVGPVGLAMTWGQDRDLLFIASTAGDELRALNICTSLLDGGPLPDGGPDPNTCTSLDSFQFVPGRIRVFPGAVLVGNRPARIAGARLLDPNDAQVGAVVVAGAEPALRLVDANNVLGSARRLPGVMPQPAQKLEIPMPAIDVVATDQPAQRVRAFAVTDATPARIATLIGLDLTVSNGAPQIIPVLHCTLDFVPSRLAVVPGPDDLAPDGTPNHVYVADGTPDGTPGGIGDGAVEVNAQAMGAFSDQNVPPCSYRRLAASDPADNPRVARPLRSIALNPPFYKSGAPDRVPGGLFLMGATLPNTALCGVPPPVAPPDPASTASMASDPTCGGGRIIFVALNPGGTGTSQVMRAPVGGVTDILNQPPGDPPMEPLRPSFPAREVSFLLPKLGCVDEVNGALVPRTSGFCTDVTAGSLGSGVTLTPRQIQLGAIAVLDDGSTAILNAGDLRFITDQFDVTGTFTSPALTSTPALAPSITPGADTPQLVFPNDGVYPGDAGLVNPCPEANQFGCMTGGVTRTLRWIVAWRANIPGLEGIAGTLHRVSTSPSVIRLDLPTGKSLQTWISSPTLQLQAGDLVKLVGFTPLPIDADPGCADVSSFSRIVDLTITTVTASSIEFAGVPTPGDLSYRGFDPPAKCIDGRSVVVQVVTGDTPAGEWLVTAGQDVRGRVKQNQQFVGFGQRFDYPPVSGTLPPVGEELVFAPIGPTPLAANNPGFRPSDGTFDGTSFTFAVTSNDSPTNVRDLTSLQGFADGVLVYQNRNVPGGLFYVSLTGTNALLQASPGNLGNTGAVAIYR